MEGEEVDSRSAIDQSDDSRPVVPAKRKTSVEDDDASSYLNTDGRQVDAAHRAYIAHTAPHLLQDPSPTIHSPVRSHELLSSTSSTPHNLHSPAASPARSTQASRSTPEDDRHASSSRSTASPMPHARSLQTESSPAQHQRSHHLVPKRFRGPLPMLGDAEELGPLPSLVPAHGFEDMFNVNNYPVNRNSWRYVAAGPASQALPLTVYRTLETEPFGVHWSWSDRSVFTHLSSDASIVAATNGFRSARANVPVRQGSWYCEIHILQPQGPSCESEQGHHVRLGWARREAGLNAPVGSTGYSYGVRDATGEKVFLSRTYSYGRPFKPGDVVGMWISLPSTRTDDDNNNNGDRIERKRIPIRYRGRLYFEQLEYAGTKEMECLMARSRKGEKLAALRGPGLNERVIHPLTGMLTMPKKDDTNMKSKRKPTAGPPGSATAVKGSSTLRSLPTLGPESQIGFFINGEPQGIAFENLLDFRPLRRQRKDVEQSGTMKAKANSARSLGDKQDSDEEERVDVITAHSTAASVLKSRENHFDDGALGYFPFVSLFGNARAKLVSRQEDFAFPPPTDVRQALLSADKARETDQHPRQTVQLAAESPTMPCRALEHRYAEFMNEMWLYDRQDEEKEKRRSELRKDDSSSSEDESMPIADKKSAKKNMKRKVNARHTASSTPVPDTTPPSPASSSQRQTSIMLDDGDVTVKMEDVMAAHNERSDHLADLIRATNGLPTSSPTDVLPTSGAETQDNGMLLDSSA